MLKHGVIMMQGGKLSKQDSKDYKMDRIIFFGGKKFVIEGMDLNLGLLGNFINFT